MHSSEYWIDKLKLVPHPEGGYFRETYRCADEIPGNTFQGFTGNRNVSTAIYFLIPAGKISAFHKIKSDELWFFHAGETLLIHTLGKEGWKKYKLGLDLESKAQPQVIIPANTWFGAEVEGSQGYVLVSCTVAPGFDFQDFEMADRATLLESYPEHAPLINRLTYDK